MSIFFGVLNVLINVDLKKLESQHFRQAAFFPRKQSRKY